VRGGVGRALLSALLLTGRADAIALGLHRTFVVTLGLLLLIRAAAARAEAKHRQHAQQRCSEQQCPTDCRSHGLLHREGVVAHEVDRLVVLGRRHQVALGVARDILGVPVKAVCGSGFWGCCFGGGRLRFLCKPSNQHSERRDQCDQFSHSG